MKKINLAQIRSDQKSNRCGAHFENTWVENKGSNGIDLRHVDRTIVKNPTEKC